ncbi:MAG: DUF4197 domain-containing protein [Reichenbachiella sp.]|uniref:DUF4197 domain-containing protein n=1 Tax=Reichenbachiella sp. TaxID=2184521 RepID=UPI003266E452
MRTSIFILALCLSTILVNAQDFNALKKKAESSIPSMSNGKLTEKEVAAGLKEALNRGVEKGVNKLSKPDGYFKDPQIKILMPKEAREVESKLRSLGQGDKVDQAIKSMNRAAEDAASEAKTLFVAAIKDMDIKDAMSILRGDNDSATKYLKKSTRAQLTKKFQPKIKTSLENVDATKYWNTVFSSYNKLPFVDEVNPDLEKYVTKKAINGLFVQVAKQELEIRKNPKARVSDLLKKVFE